MELTSNLVLELNEQPFLLEKRIELLKAIEQEGSISKAAKAVPMSYKAAWDAVDAMNNLSHIPIVSRETGGKGGGGTTLTEYGKNLLNSYTVLKKEQKIFLDRLEKMTDLDSGTLKTIERLSMQISARNQLSGTITKIAKGMVNAQICISLKSGNTIVSVITNNAVEALGLSEGDEVTAFFKSSSVILGKGDMEISAQNRLEGTVQSVETGMINSEVVVSMGDYEKVVAVVDQDSIQDLGLETGSNVYTMIKSNDIMIGK